ncbi:proline--tRNA ligase [Candidatus Peregrinibacteria bacterium]|jgi:prolyl-tRNA synthetase|nr:proline--tRNA ligase [Candidatus Peregrinibacteria bacterium]
MLYSTLFGKTIKNVDQNVKLISHRLLLQAGFIRESVAGRYYFLPLGMKVRDKVVDVIEEEMDKAGAQKMITPVLHPLELWEETNRTSSVGFELMTIEDQRGAKFALGGTAEEMMVDVVRKFNISYKDLPFNIYQFSPKFRDEKRARGGLLRVREFLMKDGYSFHADEKDFKQEYEKMWQTYSTIFDRMGLKTVPIESDNGYIGGDYCHEFVVNSEIGESRFLMTEDGSYAAHEEVAVFKREMINPEDEPKPMEIIEQPEWVQTMEDNEKHYKLPSSRFLKNVVYKTKDGRLIIATLRGDLQANPIKVAHAVKAVGGLEPATDKDLATIGTKTGYVHCWGYKGVTTVGDLSLKTVVNFIGGQKEEKTDSFNVNYGRDFECDVLADIALPPEGCMTEDGKKMVEGRGIEVGNIFQLGTHYSTKMDKAVFTDSDGKAKPYYMGCYGIGVGRTMGTIVEVHHDDKGIVWPKNVAPYQVHMTQLGNDEGAAQKARETYEKLLAAGFETLYDDRDARAGEKLNNADLIGIPVRLVISNRSLENGGFEWKIRSEEESRIVAEDDLISELTKFYEA